MVSTRGAGYQGANADPKTKGYENGQQSHISATIAVHGLSSRLRLHANEVVQGQIELYT
jgi:hypothetical protein